MIYDFYRKVAKILGREHEESLFNYIIHSMDDDGGFLRSRYCYWDKELENQKFDNEIKTVLVSLRSPFDFNSSINYYDEKNVRNGTGTVLKMQLFYFDLSDEDHFMEEAKWSAGVGFPYIIKIDMVNESYEVLGRVELI